MNDFLNFLVTGWYWILIAIVGLIILVKFIPRYKIAPPDTALIISGLIRRNYKVRNPDGKASMWRKITAVRESLRGCCTAVNCGPSPWAARNLPATVS